MEKSALILVDSMQTPETVVNITNVLMGLLTTTAVLLGPSGTRTVSTVTGQLMWTAVQVVNMSKIIISKVQ